MAPILLQVGTDPVLAIVVVYLYRFWEIGVGTKIWCENISESAQLFRIAIHVYPKRIELVVIKEKSEPLFLLASCISL